LISNLSTGGEQRLDLQADCDGAQQLVAKLLRSHRVPEPLEGGIERLTADAEDPPESTPDRYCPAPAVAGHPVRRDDRGAGVIPAIGKVDVDEGLNEHGVDLSSTLSCKGPDVVRQDSSDKSSSRLYRNACWASTPALRTQLHIGGRGNHQGGAESELESAGGAGHQKHGWVDIADADDVRAASQRLLDHGHDGAADQQKIVVQSKGNNRLHIPDIQRAVGLGGWRVMRALEITPELVGQWVAQFVALEVKTASGVVSPEQRAFLRLVQKPSSCLTPRGKCCWDTDGSSRTAAGAEASRKGPTRRAPLHPRSGTPSVALVPWV